ncbi:DNA polymerase III subunit alpha [Candidatus Daviesbacteria bacterium RIFCSPLOWO2_01_FULL_39_12]|uniref:DNA polymerase III subunit alpha n=1 Tax=Candidatus Daviesbacteria bacterium RIFCSPLOWO2_01_FULL_39_12 TaxID=1797785 RepID=A0A1F5KSU7_9BACT|nr:MAG: DNA polymerase III subunit alpha [Candidatus Daviesbacteria bacterium RIFCSPLOWO2_01_FULL_39_12]
MPKFVHLHSHSEYSLLDGLSKIPKMVKTAKDLGMEALGLTDHGSMYGAIEFYKECKQVGIKPIIGVEMYVAKRSYKDKEGKLDSEPFHLTVLAKNYQGYLNLMKLVTIAHTEGYYYRPRVDKKLLAQYSEGLIALSGCPSGEFIRTLDNGGIEKAMEVAKTYLEIFGPDNFYFELQNHPYEKSLEEVTDQAIRKDLEKLANLQQLAKESVVKLSQKMDIQIVATNDFHYTQKEDAEAQDVLLCVQTGAFISEANRLRMIDTPDYYLKSSQEMAESFKDLPQALENTVKIANEVDLEIPLGIARFPLFQTPQDLSSMDYLRELTYQKAEGKLDLSDEAKERLEYELGVIEKKKYADYFLVVWDFMDWAHQHGVITNTRGSAAGSLVLYCLGVTNLNPLGYLLPFERFLTVHRPTLPDIDCDMADDRRDEVIGYVTQKYGEDKVAHIVTFGTMMGRAAIRDVGRVLGLSYGEVDRIAKLIPPPHQGFHKPLFEAIREIPELSDMHKNNAQIRKLLDLAVKIEGTVRHASVHAAGIVIAPEDITNFTPLQKESDGDKLVSQYDMFAIEDAGLVKMDFLGIRNLSILGRAVEFVKENRQIDVDINNIPLDDRKAFELLAKGETMGVFQLEGSGMTRYLVDLKPTNIFDIQAMVALYRPGPISVIPEYIVRKHNPKKIHYFDPRMKSFTQASLGLLVYQDDVLLTAINLAGYSWEEADKFRKAMGKKIPSEMAKQKDRFVEGCVSSGINREKAEELFGLIAPFAAYGFNKAHAASYAMVAYQTAYMKANFPVEFMAALMSAESGNIDKIAAAIEECRRLGIVVLPPDVNKSGVGFSLEKLKALSEEELERSLSVVAEEGRSGEHMGIRFGLSAIKNVGELAIQSILQAREADEFVSLMDLCSRVDNRLVNRKTLESLIKAGAMDNLGLRAAQLLILDQCLEESHKLHRANLSGQVSLFEEVEDMGSLAIKLPEVEEMALEQLLTFEKELLGFYLHEPPFLKKLQVIGGYTSMKLADLSEAYVGQKLTLGGVITEMKKVLTKRNASEMAFVRISDGLAEIEVVVFPALFAESKEFLGRDEVVIISGRIDKREEELSLIADTIDIFDPQNENIIEIYVPSGTDVGTLQNINRTLRGYPGNTPVVLLLPNGGTQLRRMNLPFSISAEPALEEKIKGILGQDAFKRL